MIDPLPTAALRWRCDPASLPFDSTDAIEPIPGVIGQDSALEALAFGLETAAIGQNIFVRGLAGTGRMTMVRRLLEVMRPSCPVKKDCCYVHNFAQPDRPRLIVLPAGKAREFRRRVHAFADFIREGLKDALAAEALRARRDALDREAKREIDALTQPFEEALKGADLALVSLQIGPVAQAAIFPLVDGRPVPPEEFEQLRAQGRVTEAQYALYRQRHESFRKRLEEVTDEIRRIRRQHAQRIDAVVAEAARAILTDLVRLLIADFPGESVARFLSEVVDDAVQRHVSHALEDGDFTQLYRVNVVLEQEPGTECPIIIENSPTMSNLLGVVEREWTPRGAGGSDFTMIRAGSLLRADGGFLIMEAREVLTEPGAWKVLVRTLRTGRLEIVPPELSVPWFPPALKPEPIPVSVKVILLGDVSLYALLDAYDPDFPNLFKVLADFDTEIPRGPEAFYQYSGVLARIVREESLPPFDRTALAALIEHGARIAAHRGKLTTRFGRIADIAREAAYVAGQRGSNRVAGSDVKDAIRRGKRRADLPSRRFRELISDGTIRVDVQGEVVGQINGLAVVSAGPLTYGFPARISATIGVGTAGVIDIEREAALSGAIHTKGFYILGGLLRYLVGGDHPLAFSASIAFEQSYGGIDGDSASGAEICCLLSALTGIPIRQNFAMTGAIDQFGNILAVGAVNEKIEGFFDACRDLGLTGTQGVLVPRANAGDLMLRDDVVEACAAGQFRVFAVATILEALEVLTGTPAGVRDKTGTYPEGTLLRIAQERAYEFWQRAARSPASGWRGEKTDGGRGERDVDEAIGGEDEEEPGMAPT
jgi:predicted ATP-dependent protease